MTEINKIVEVVEVKLTKSWGHDWFAPINDNAKLFSSIVKYKKNLTRENLETIKKLGFRIVVTHDHIEI